MKKQFAAANFLQIIQYFTCTSFFLFERLAACYQPHFKLGNVKYELFRIKFARAMYAAYTEMGHHWAEKRNFIKKLTKVPIKSLQKYTGIKPTNYDCNFCKGK